MADALIEEDDTNLPAPTEQEVGILSHRKHALSAKLAADVEAWLAAGNQITVAEIGRTELVEAGFTQRQYNQMRKAGLRGTKAAPAYRGKRRSEPVGIPRSSD